MCECVLGGGEGGSHLFFRAMVLLEIQEVKNVSVPRLKVDGEGTGTLCTHTTRAVTGE